MDRRDDSLTRVAEVRDKNTVAVVDMDLNDIKNQFDQNLADIIAKFAVADKFLISGETSNCEDMWRTQIVFLDSAFDYYIHQITKYGMNKMYRGEWTKSDQYKGFSVNMEILEEAMKNPENQSWFLELVNGRYEKIPFMSYDDVNKQLKLIGIKERDVSDRAFHKIGCNIATIKQYKEMINGLYYRRNAIAHQSDRSHTDNSKNTIQKSTVEGFIDGIRKIVDSIHNIMNEKNSVE